MARGPRSGMGPNCVVPARPPSQNCSIPTPLTPTHTHTRARTSTTAPSSRDRYSSQNHMIAPTPVAMCLWIGAT